MTRRIALLGALAPLAACGQQSSGTPKTKMLATFPVDPIAAKKLRSQIAAAPAGANNAGPDAARENHLLAVLLLCGDPNNLQTIMNAAGQPSTGPFKDADPDA